MHFYSKKGQYVISYESCNQIQLDEFKTPFEMNLNTNNRWVKLSTLLPWDDLVSVYTSKMSITQGRASISPRVVIGSLFIKHRLNLSDEETVEQIRENPYLQFFIGNLEFKDEYPFVPSLFVEIRKRLGFDEFDKINDAIIAQSILLKSKFKQKAITKKPKANDNNKEDDNNDDNNDGGVSHKGKIIIDATVAEQSIKFPTDLDLLNNSREFTEKIIDILYSQLELQKKPRTYRRRARKEFLSIIKQKKKKRNVLRKVLRKQLGYLTRNIKTISFLFSKVRETEEFPLSYKLLHKYWIIQTIKAQQEEMYLTRSNKCDNRIVSISQPFVRPILRGKSNKKTEFGSKLGVSLVDGYAKIDTLSWNAYNESSDLLKQVANYKNNYGFYPEVVIADNIYGSRANRKELKNLGIRFSGKPLGRMKKITDENKDSIRRERELRKKEYRERIPVEGKFGQGKNGYRLNYIRAKTRKTSESWISSIFFVMNIVKMVKEITILLWIIIIKKIFVKLYKENELRYV